MIYTNQVIYRTMQDWLMSKVKLIAADIQIWNRI